ncbi:MAG: hypothetical protein HRT69_08295 [Flavobacteriaceae bacterium]|nr:hypothetical protein [Flavobacteriaceae bacterium]
MKYYSILFILFVFSSCNVSTLSNSDATNLAKMKVNITIQDGTKKNSLDYIEVKLSDGKKQIINKNIKIILNNKPLELFVRQGNYYDKYPWYGTDDLLRNESYYFEIVLPDSTKYPLAFIKPLKRRDNAKFNIPKKNSKNKDLKLEWENINSLTNVEIWKIVHLKAKPNMHSGGRYAETTIHHTINTESGKYTVPKLFFEDSLTITDYLIIRLSSKESGLINPELILNSKISYTYLVEKTIDLEE